MHPELQRYIKRALAHIDEIPSSRARILDDLVGFLRAERIAGNEIRLTFICTHNSRRSQMGQLWAAAAAAQFGVERVHAFSGGTEATAFDPRAVAAIERAGFAVQNPGGVNPHYLVTYDETASPIECFSKKYDDPFNPGEGFVAVMTCSDADEACPVVTGASLRVPIRYDDPKAADGMPSETATYDARCFQIATEMLSVFSRVA